MKKKICGLLLIIGMVLILGIVGGIENGEPLSNGFWCFPILFVMWAVVRFGEIFE